jgi:uncharacterized protein (TIGR03083 family)
MSEQAILGLKSEIEAVRDLGRNLSSDDWELPSACWGWSVKDVFSHMASIWHGLVDPGASPLPTFEDVEAENEVPVEARRSWTAKEVLAEYEDFCDGALEVLTGFQAPEARDTPFPAGALGTYPIHILANALMFDHFAHLREDILHPFGPIRRPHPPASDDLIRPAVEWMLAGLPTMCPAVGAALARPVLLDLKGPGGGTWLLSRNAETGQATVQPDGSPSDAASHATGTAESFIGWGTQRRDWRRSGVRLSGDPDLAAAVFDAINIV